VTCLDDTQVALFVDGALAGERREQVMAHLDGCDLCRGLVADVASSRGRPGRGDGELLRAIGGVGGRYELHEVMGAGAMGVVYRAFDPRLSRHVALKILRPRVDGSEGEALGEQLLAEAHALARLAHPNVVSVFDVGTHDGQVFVAMELARETLAAWLRAGGHTTAETLRLVRQAGEGLAAAHATGIVHRDVKPANVLIGVDGRARVTDFGLALRAGVTAALPETAALAAATVTRTGALIGTPAYMAPEQLRGQPADERADQFAFAVMMCEALAGARPFTATTVSELRAAVTGERIDRQVLARLPRWLRRIVLRALKAEPRLRFPDMRALLVAIDRGPPLTRTRVAVGATVAAAATVAAVIGGLSIERTVRARHAAEARRDELIVLQARAALDRDPTASLAWLKQLGPGAENWREAVPVAIDAASRGVAERVLRHDGGPVWSVAAAPDGRHFAWTRGNVVELGDVGGGVIELGGHDGEVTRVAYAGDGRTLASAGGGKIIVWDTSGPGAPRPRTTLGGYRGEIEGLAFSRDGASLASVGEEGVTRLWDVAAARAQALGDAGRRCNDLAFAPDERALATVCSGALATLHALDGGGPARRFDTGVALPRNVAFTADGKALLVASKAGLSIVPLDGTPARATDLPAGILSFAVARDLAVVGTMDRGSRLISLASLSPLATLSGQSAAVYSAALFPDGSGALTGALDGSVRLWRVPPAPPRILVAGSELHAVAVARDGRRLAAGGADGKVRLWELGTPGPPRILDGQRAKVQWLRLTPDGGVISFAEDGSVMLHRDGRERGLDGGKTPVASVAAAGDVVAWSDSEALHLRSLADASLAADLALPSNAELTLAGDGRLVIAVNDEVTACDPRRCAATRAMLLRTARPTQAITVSADGGTLAVSTTGGVIHLLDVKGGGRRAIDSGRGDLLYLALSPDARWLAAADLDGAVRLWDVATQAMQLLWRHEAQPVALGFSDDGTMLLSAARDATLRAHELQSGALHIRRGHADAITDLGLDAGLVVTASRDGTVRIWPRDPTPARFASHAELDRWLAARTSTVIDGETRATTP
jgi:WD40 repeat protein